MTIVKPIPGRVAYPTSQIGPYARSQALVRIGLSTTCRNLMVRRAVCCDTARARQPWLAIPLGVAITIAASPAATVSSTAFMQGLTLSDNRSTRNALHIDRRLPGVFVARPPSWSRPEDHAVQGSLGNLPSS